MNKRYMDFVPTRKTAVKEKKPVETERVYRSVKKTKPVVEAKKPVIATSTRKMGLSGNSRDNFTIKDEPEFGVIEDLNSRFVGNSVEKRPLNEKKEVVKTAKVAKSKRLIGRRNKREDGSLKEPTIVAKEASVPRAQTYKMPKSPFINQEKVSKRPLSRNAYQKEIVAPKEEKEGPITIIAKPNKDKHAGLIITIIITIILGAAAGTVAFLLLPK